MGEVYRARDSKLDRDVAIKVLRADVAGDPDRLARFGREARMLAALSHANIAHIHGFEDSSDTPALVMELVDGPTLADRVAQGALPLDEALEIARQVAEALEAAHEQGIIHRDLKPANIKVRPDGTVKVLDFGLAKALEPAAGSKDHRADRSPTESPTITAGITMPGVILGTAAYMPPEQVKGKPVDRRADVWAYGCVLFEMVTGRRAFDGPTPTEVMLKVIESTPDWTSLPARTPTPIRRLLLRCLEKNPKLRIDSAAMLRLEVTEALSGLSGSGRHLSDVSGAPPMGRAARLPAMAAVVAFTALATSLTTWSLTRTPATSAPASPVTRFALTLPAAQPLALSFNASDLALSPDGSRLAYTVGLQSQLMVRAFDQVDAVPLAGVTGARAPFFSADGRWVAYFDQGGELRRVSVAGGRPITICKVNGTSRGGSWSSDEAIVFATSTSQGLLRVSATGGEPAALTSVSAGERGHFYPSVLPDGQGVLFTVALEPEAGSQIAVLDPSGRQNTLIRHAAQPNYVDTGHLTYASAGSIWAIRFAPDTRQVSGPPARIVEDTISEVMNNRYVNFTVSRLGTVAYARAPVSAERSLEWIDRHGSEELIPVPARPYHHPRLSSDGTRIAVVVEDRKDWDIWTWDLGRSPTTQTLMRLTFGPGVNTYPVWTRDGRIIHNSGREGVQNLSRRATDGTGAEERLTRGPNNQRSLAISPDQRTLIFEESTADMAWNLMRVALDGASTAEVLLRTPFDERNADLSPDGRWMAYESNESGQAEVYVRPFPNVSDAVYRVSSNGGRSPAWAPNGREVFFVNGTEMYSVAVQPGATFRHASAVTLFDAPSVLFDTRQMEGGGAHRMYDVSKDGQRFLVVKYAGADDPVTARHSIVVVHNWFENATIPAR